MIESSARCEQIEREAWTDLFAALPPVERSRLGLSAQTCGTALVLRARGIDSLLFNRVIGIAEGASEDLVHSVLGRFRVQAIDRYLLHVEAESAPAPLAGCLEGSGLERFRRRRWLRYARGREAPPRVACDLRIERVDAARAADFARLIGAGFDLPDSALPLLAALIGRSGWSGHLALDGAEPVAAGALFVANGLAYLPFASTRPDHRGRGAQAALMAERIRVALELGCELVTSETGESVPGEPNSSERNMQRCGFRKVGARENWCPVGIGWLRAPGLGAA